MLRLLLLAVAVAALVACRERPAGEVLVSAAASLSDVVVDLERAFEDANPDLDLVLNTGGSSALRTQIEDGAPVDVLLSADRSNVEVLTSAGHVDGDQVFPFARNGLQLAVPRGNPAGVTSFDDLGHAALAIGLCDVHVPCGALAARVLTTADVEPDVDTREPDARSLLAKIAAGELDAGLVYPTDVRASAGAVEAVGPPTSGALTTEYVAARITGAPNPRGADAFLSFLDSGDSRLILAAHGFDSRR